MDHPNARRTAMGSEDARADGERGRLSQGLASIRPTLYDGPRMAEEDDAPSRKARVFVVDDDEAIVRVLERLLRAEHEMFAATSAAAALTRLSGDEDFDLILCDVTMPHKNGVELYRELCVVNPALARKLVFLTGGGLGARVNDFLSSTEVPVIEKPFTPQGLRDRVRELVNRKLQ